HLELLLFPCVARPTHHVAGAHLDDVAEPFVEPRASEWEERIAGAQSLYLLELAEGRDELLDARAHEEACLLVTESRELDLVLGDPIPRGLGDDAGLAEAKHALLHARDDNREVLAVIEERLEEARERDDLVFVEVVDLIDAQDEGPAARRREPCEDVDH